MLDDKETAELYFAFKNLELKFQPTICFASDSCQPNSIINSHSISNKRILNKISDNGHVITYEVILKSGKLYFDFKEKGINNVSTFPGFCSEHDSDIFRLIDYFDYIEGDQQQEFLFCI